MTVLTVVVSIALLPLMLLTKLAEGVYVSLRITREGIQNLWRDEE